jgi:hypothetical protein
MPQKINFGESWLTAHMQEISVVDIKNEVGTMPGMFVGMDNKSTDSQPCRSSPITA